MKVKIQESKSTGDYYQPGCQFRRKKIGMKTSLSSCRFSCWFSSQNYNEEIWGNELFRHVTESNLDLMLIFVLVFKPKFFLRNWHPGLASSSTARFWCFFRCYLPASEAVPHQVPFMTSAVSTNLLLPHIQSDRQRPQKFNKSLSSGHTSTAEKKQQNRGVTLTQVSAELFNILPTLLSFAGRETGSAMQPLPQ